MKLRKNGQEEEDVGAARRESQRRRPRPKREREVCVPRAFFSSPCAHAPVLHGAQRITYVASAKLTPPPSSSSRAPRTYDTLRHAARLLVAPRFSPSSSAATYSSSRVVTAQRRLRYRPEQEARTFVL